MILGALALTVPDEKHRVRMQHTKEDQREALEYAFQLVLPQNDFGRVLDYYGGSGTEDDQVEIIRQALTTVAEAVVPGNSDMNQIHKQQMNLMLRITQQRVIRLSSRSISSGEAAGNSSSSSLTAEHDDGATYTIYSRGSMTTWKSLDSLDPPIATSNVDKSSVNTEPITGGNRLVNYQVTTKCFTTVFPHVQIVSTRMENGYHLVQTKCEPARHPSQEGVDAIVSSLNVTGTLETI